MRFMGVQYQKEKKNPVSLRDRILHLLYSSILIAYCKLKITKSTQLLKSPKCLPLKKR